MDDAALDDDREGFAVILAVGAILPIAVGALLVIVRDDVLNANLALILMGVVVLVASGGGRKAGALAGLTAALSFDFFLTEPYLTLRISDDDDIETAIILLVVGLIVGQFAEWAHANRRSTSAARSELGRIRRVADMLSQGADPEAIKRAGQAEITTLLALRSCRFEDVPFDAVLPRLERSGVLDHAAVHESVVRRYTHRGFELPAEGVELPVFNRGSQVGRYVLEPSPGVGISLEQRVVALALADQVGAALAT